MREADVSVLAIGFFDGVHLGHQAILRGASAALTFRNHPLSVLAPDRAPPLMMSLGERVSAMRECGVSDVLVLDFTQELADLAPDAFLSKARLLHPFSAVRCGADWRFGRGGEGNAQWLRSHGTTVEVAPYAEWHGERISSSRIRAALSRGEVEDASAMTGRPLRVSGRRFRGKGLGGSLGFPTVNIESDAPVLKLLPRGVYAVEMSGRRGIANYGVAPTLGDGAWSEPVLEVHFPEGVSPDVPEIPESPANQEILANPESLANQKISVNPANPESPENPEFPARLAVPTKTAVSTVTVSFLSFIRPERRFPSLAALKSQIETDCASFCLVNCK